MNDKLLKELAYAYKDEIIEPYATLLDTIGFEGVSAVSEQLGGALTYIPAKRTIFWGCIKRQIAKEFNGINYKQLSRKYEICEKTVKNIVKGA